MPSRYNHQPEQRAHRKRYEASPKGKQAKRRYEATDGAQAKRRVRVNAQRATPEGRAKQQAYDAAYKARRKRQVQRAQRPAAPLTYRSELLGDLVSHPGYLPMMHYGTRLRTQARAVGKQLTTRAAGRSGERVRGRLRRRR